MPVEEVMKYIYIYNVYIVLIYFFFFARLFGAMRFAFHANISRRSRLRWKTHLWRKRVVN